MLPVIAIPFVIGTDIPQHSAMEFALESFGYVLLMGGMGLRIWATLYIGGKKSSELVRLGPYSICRNPLYLGTLLIMTGVAFLFASLPMLLAILMLFVPVTLATIREEERHLEQIFGQEYCDYRRQTRRLWPSLAKYASPKHLEVSTYAIARVATEAASILLIPLAEDLLDLLRTHGIMTALWTFRMTGLL